MLQDQSSKRSSRSSGFLSSPARLLRSPRLLVARGLPGIELPPPGRVARRQESWRILYTPLDTIQLLDHVESDFLTDDRVKVVGRVTPDVIADPRRRRHQGPVGSFADEVQVHVHLAAGLDVNIQCVQIQVD